MPEVLHSTQHKNPKCFNLVTDGQQISVYSKCDSFQNIAEILWRSGSLKSCFGPIYIKNIRFSTSQLSTPNNEGNEIPFEV